jgi:NRPS condensation-like uncharacterized protein
MTGARVKRPTFGEPGGRMQTSSTIPATLPVHFGECMIHACAESDLYRAQLGAVVSLHGHLDAPRLRRALRLLVDAEPVLGCRFATDVVPPVWERLEDLEAEHLLEVRRSDDPSAAAAAFVAEPLDQDADPQVLAALVLGPTTDTLAVKVSHVAMDGGALKQTLYLIAEMYRRLADEPDWTPVPNLDGLRGAMAPAGLVERIRAIPRSSTAASPPESDWSVPVLGGRGPGTYVWATIEPDLFRRATVRAKSAGASVNDFILTAYYRTCFRLLRAAPGSHTPISIPCELRKHLPEGARTALSNIASTWWISVSPVEGESFDDTLSRVAAATSEWKRSGAGKQAAIWMPAADRLLGRHALGLFRAVMSKGARAAAGRGGPPGLTNIGVIDESRLDFGEDAAVDDAWLLGPISIASVILAVTTFRDRLHLAVGTEFAAVSEQLVNEAVQGTVGEIRSWAADSTTSVA